jgi:hypothetical protein
MLISADRSDESVTQKLQAPVGSAQRVLDVMRESPDQSCPALLHALQRCLPALSVPACRALTLNQQLLLRVCASPGRDVANRRQHENAAVHFDGHAEISAGIPSHDLVVHVSSSVRPLALSTTPAANRRSPDIPSGWMVDTGVRSNSSRS